MSGLAGSVSGVWLDRWVGIAALAVGVIGAWDKLRALAVRLVRGPVVLVGGIIEILRGPEPLWWKLAQAVDYFGGWLGGWSQDHPRRHPRLFVVSTVPLTTWLRYPGRGVDSYRRHWRVLQEHGMDLLAR
jgi:hypothetical protein